MIIAKEIIKMFEKRLGEAREAKSSEKDLRLAAKLNPDIAAGDIEKEEIDRGADRKKEQ